MQPDRPSKVFYRVYLLWFRIHYSAIFLVTSNGLHIQMWKKLKGRQGPLSDFKVIFAVTIITGFSTVSTVWNEEFTCPRPLNVCSSQRCESYLINFNLLGWYLDVGSVVIGVLDVWEPVSRSLGQVLGLRDKPEQLRPAWRDVPKARKCPSTQKETHTSTRTHVRQRLHLIGQNTAGDVSGCFSRPLL